MTGSPSSRTKSHCFDHYTLQYPAVVKLNEKIAQKEASRRGWMLGGLRELKCRARMPSSTSIIGQDEDTSLGQLRGQLEANRLEMQNLY